jgi:hypothetical protein
MADSERATDTEHPIVSDGYYISIGKLTVQWTVFQAIVDESIHVLAHLSPHAGLCLTAQLQSMPSKRYCLLALLDLRKCPEHLRKEMDKLLEAAAAQGSLRNKVIHDALQIDGQKIVRRSVNARGKFEVSFNELDAITLDQATTEISLLTSRFLELFAQIKPTLAPVT